MGRLTTLQELWREFLPGLESSGQESRDPVDQILRDNKVMSEAYLASILSLERYWHDHDTSFMFTFCSDGRISPLSLLQIPLGIVEPLRNIGGRFRLGWYGFQKSFENWVLHWVRDQGHFGLVVATYHFASGTTEPRGAVERGCAGWKNDTAKARQYVSEFVDTINGVHKKHRLLAILCGIDTDLDALILHGEDGRELNLATLPDRSPEYLLQELGQRFPSLAKPETPLQHFGELLLGNQARIESVRDRPIKQAMHRETILAIGRKFDAMIPNPNRAIILGPFDPHIAPNIDKGGGIHKENIREDRIDPDKLVLLTSAPYGSPGYDRGYAVEKARENMAIGVEVLQEFHPDLLPRYKRLPGVLNTNSMLFEPL